MKALLPLSICRWIIAPKIAPPFNFKFKNSFEKKPTHFQEPRLLSLPHGVESSRYGKFRGLMLFKPKTLNAFDQVIFYFNVQVFTLNTNLCPNNVEAFHI
jgi:hypothetical protein